MKRFRRYVVPYLDRVFYTFLIWCTVSCASSSEEPNASVMEDDGIHVSILLAGQSDDSTRSGEGEDSDNIEGEFGSVSENYINYKDLYLMTFSISPDETTLSDNSKLLEVLWKPSMTNNSVVLSSGERIYLTSKLDGSIGEYISGDFCLVAIANIKSFGKTISDNELKNITTFSDLKGKLFCDYKKGNSNEWSWQPANTSGTGIPMFGVKRVDLQGYDPKIFNEGNPFILQSKEGPTLWLLRAFAKVTVELVDDLGLPVGEKVDIKLLSGGGIGNKYAAKFNVIPTLDRMKGFKGESGFEGTGGTGFIDKQPTTEELSFINGATPESGKNLMFNVSTDGKKAFMYLPEYQFANDEEELPELTLCLSIGEGIQMLKFKFKEYPENGVTRSDAPVWKYVLRNHSYHYKVGLDFRIISVIPDSWGEVFDNEFTFG